MEEWVGTWWHRAITRTAERPHAAARVDLDEMAKPIGLLFRAGGGHPGLRITAADESATGGPRRWLQHLAGSGLRAAQPRLDTDCVALPPSLALYPERALNRDLYLWLAALAAHFQPTGDWLVDNVAATARALHGFPGLRARHAALVAAHLAQRPDPRRLRPAAAAAEARVRAALADFSGHPACPDICAPPERPVPVPALGPPPAPPAGLVPTDVAPVWLWLDVAPAAADALQRAHTDTSDTADAPPPGARPAPIADARRRRATAAQLPTERSPFMLFFRAESLLSWGELVRVNRPTDDSDDGNALAAANDMDTLALAPDGRSAASRVRFDLDLPSAAADDLPLGPGHPLPEWDHRQRRLLPDHCRVQTLVARPVSDGQVCQPSPALRRTARRMRRRLEVLRAAPRWSHAMPDGEAIDLDAWVRHASRAVGDRASGASVPTPSERANRPPAVHDATPAVYRQRTAHDRSLATLLLADLSMSTDAHVNDTQRVVDVVRDALYVFGEGLSATGDAFEMLGFSSVRRHHVRLQHLKGFDEPWDARARQRVAAVKPGFYTRMGAAVREGTRRLSARGERQRLLLLLTDGKPNDLDVYEGRYGLEDTRHAVQAARQAGLTPFCVTIDDQARTYLPMLFGEAGFALVRRPEQLVARLAQVYAQLTR